MIALNKLMVHSTIPKRVEGNTHSLKSHARTHSVVSSKTEAAFFFGISPPFASQQFKLKPRELLVFG